MVATSLTGRGFHLTIACWVVLVLLLSFQLPHVMVNAFRSPSPSSSSSSSADHTTPPKKGLTFRVAPREYAILSDPATESFTLTRQQLEEAYIMDQRERQLFDMEFTTEYRQIQQPKPSSSSIDEGKPSKSALKDKKLIPVVERATRRRSNRSSKGWDIPYETALAALQTYYSQHGNLVLPQKFIVPEDDVYPSIWHGLDLAGTVYDMKWWQTHVKQRPNRVTELNELGFIWERLQPQWNLVLTALITYSNHYGNVKVPTRFVVPSDDTQWPKATWGISLGNCVYRIRSRHDFLRGANAGSRRAQLDGLGFVWEVGDNRFRTFYRALKHYITQSQKDGPKTSVAVSSIASIPKPKIIRVPSTFVVPNHNDKWPEELWNYPLGAKCIAVRQKELYVKNNPERMQALIELGFHSNGNAHLGWLNVVHAAAIYSRLNRNKLNVPYKFVVPAPKSHHKCENQQYQPTTASTTTTTTMMMMLDDDDWPWPERLWGFPLGQRLKDIRVKGAYLKGLSGPARRAQLDALGFEWTPKRGPRQ